MSPRSQSNKRRTRAAAATAAEAAIDLTADFESPAAQPRRASKRTRSPPRTSAGALAGVETFDLTKEAPPAQAPKGASRSSRTRAKATAEVRPAAPTTQRRSAARSRRDKAAGPAAAVPETQSLQISSGDVSTYGFQQDMFMLRGRRQQEPPQPGSAPAAAQPSAAADQLPAWHNMKGAKRLQAELRYLTHAIAAGKLPCVHDLTPVDDNIFTWEFKLKDFDNDCEGGRDLNDDLSVLQALHGQDHLLMEAAFPRDYPNAPFFLRLVTPRCQWYTGHVTAGGAICIEGTEAERDAQMAESLHVLTQSGTPNSWNTTMCVESIINTVLLNMLHCESVMVRTASGPGGRSGPLRIDLQGHYHYNVMHPYSEHEAKAAFHRMLSHHRANGW